MRITLVADRLLSLYLIRVYSLLRIYPFTEPKVRPETSHLEE